MAAAGLAAGSFEFAPGGHALAAPSCPTLGGTALTPASSSPVSPPGGHPFVLCTAKVPSFDGTPLDLDLSLPTVPYIPAGRDEPAPPPLMLFMHGWGNSKTEWESSTLEGNGAAYYHWNNAWFASQGWVVLTYSARGFHQSCGKDSGGYLYATDPNCSGRASWTHLADRRWEVHDAQYLAGLIADAGLINARQVVASGGSYGGGQSWDLALSQDQIVASTSTDPAHPTVTPWISPAKHIAMHLAAAVPHYPWADLQDALLPNGRAADGFNGAPKDGSHQTPYGVDKQSYVDGLFALGEATAQFAAPGADPTADLTTWDAGVNAGEPYTANPSAQTAAAEVGGVYRSPFAMAIPAPSHQIPVYVIQGFTDPLFNALQALYMINRLRTAYSSYPVWAFLGDVGHSYADNPSDVWQQAHNASNAFLTSVLAGKTPSLPRITADTTRCVSGQTLHTFTASSFGSIANTRLSLTSAAAQTTVSSSAVTPEGANADPIANSGCRSMAASQSDPNQASYSFAVPSASTIVGGPVVSVTVTVTGSSAELDARLWDIDAAGNQTLVSRTPYRLEEGTNGTTVVPLTFELWPNAWQLQCGHTLKLELTQDDSPTWRPDNEPSSIALSGLKLTLPAVAGPRCL